MKMSLLVRVSSGIALVFAAGHTLGSTKFWSPMGDNLVPRRMALAAAG